MVVQKPLLLLHLCRKFTSCQVMWGLQTTPLCPAVSEFGYQSLALLVPIMCLLLAIVWLVLFGCLKYSVKKAGWAYVYCRIGLSLDTPLQIQLAVAWKCFRGSTHQGYFLTCLVWKIAFESSSVFSSELTVKSASFSLEAAVADKANDAIQMDSFKSSGNTVAQG